MKKVFSTIFVIIIISYHCFSQGVPVLIKGKVLDEFSTAPVQVTMVIKGKDDKKIKIQPNILTGEYQQTIVSGQEIEVTFLNYDIVKETKTITIDNSDTYKEINVDFTIKKMTPNQIIYSFNCFTENSTEINDECNKFFKDFIDVYKFNRGAKFRIELNSTKLNKKTENLKIKSLKSACSIWSQFSDRYTVEIVQSDSDYDLLIVVTEIKDPLK